MKYASIPVISAAALSLMGGAAWAESLEPQHATAENTPPVLAQVDNPARLTDAEMTSVVAGAPIYYPNSGLIYDPQTGVIRDTILGFDYTGLGPEAAKAFIEAANSPIPLATVPQVPQGMSREEAARLEGLFTSRFLSPSWPQGFSYP